MIVSLNLEELKKYTESLLTNFFPDDQCLISPNDISDAFLKLENCFNHINRKYYRTEFNETLFDHLNADHFCSFLYILSNTIWNNEGDEVLCNKLFYLNKIMHGLDLYYKVNLPEIFLFIHPVGSVIGNASFENYSVFYQNVTIGSDGDAYPKFNNGTVFFSKSSVIGNCSVGENVVFGANAFILNTDIPAQCSVVGSFPNHKILSSQTKVKGEYFGQE